MPFTSAHEKCLTQKVGTFGSLGLISMIQPPFCSSCVALQYEPRIKFFHRAVPELQDIQYWCKNFISTRNLAIQVQILLKKKSAIDKDHPSVWQCRLPTNLERQKEHSSAWHLRFTSLTHGRGKETPSGCIGFFPISDVL